MLTPEEIKIAANRARVYPANVNVTCWFSDQSPHEDTNGLVAVHRLIEKKNLEFG